MDAHTSSSCYTPRESRDVSGLGIEWCEQCQPPKLLQGLHLLVLDHLGVLPLISNLSGSRRCRHIIAMIDGASVCIGEPPSAIARPGSMCKIYLAHAENANYQN